MQLFWMVFSPKKPRKWTTALPRVSKSLVGSSPWVARKQDHITAVIPFPSVSLIWQLKLEKNRQKICQRILEIFFSNLFATRYATIAVWPNWAARWRPEQPSPSFMFGSAPCCINSITIWNSKNLMEIISCHFHSETSS